MIRTNTVTLTVIPALAYRHKLKDGGSGITILRADYKQPGIASISTKTGEPIPSVNTDKKMFPAEAFKEAMDLTRGMSYKKQGNVTVTKDMFKKDKKKEKTKVKEEVTVNEADYQKIIDKYTDKTGKFSYDLMNKDMIRLLKTSKVVGDMVAEGKNAAAIRNYVVGTKFRHISGNGDLTDKQVKKMMEMLEEADPKGAFKELNSEIRKLLSKNKKK